jgi:citrate lyase alpha subunit
VDLIVTDGGIAINPKQTPRRSKLETQLHKENLPITSITDLKEEAHSLASPLEPNFTSNITTLVEYRDGTYLDVIYGVEP